MRLRKIRIQNYRSIKDVSITLPLDRPVILLGSNNAGKTNILSAILTLRLWDPRYFLEKGEFHPTRGGAAIYTTSNPNAVSMLIPKLDPLTEQFANSGSPLRGLSAETEITLTISWQDDHKDEQREQIVCGFNSGYDSWLPYVKNKKVLLNLPKYGSPSIQIWDSGTGDPKGYLDYLKTVRGIENNNIPDWFRKLTPEIDKSVSKSTGDINDFDNLSRDENHFFVGNGQQAYVSRLGNLAAGEIVKSTIANIQCVLIDEPETHLHPNAEEELLEKIQKASQEGVQVIYATHSENFLSADNIEGFVRVYRDKDGITKVCQLTNEELFHTCNPMEEEYKKLPIGEDYWSVELNSDQLKGFFADVVLLVEGPTEYYSLPKYLSQSFLSKTGVQIVSCYGKSAIEKYWRLFTAYGYKCFILYDHDADEYKGKREKQEEVNKKLEALFYGKKKEGDRYSISETAAYFTKDWEDCFESEIGGENYEKIKSDLKEKDIVLGKEKNASPKPMAASALASKVVKKKIQIPFIEDLKLKLCILSDMNREEYERYLEKVKKDLEAL